MDSVVMKLDENTEFHAMNLSKTKGKQPNVGMVKQEAPEADNILLQHEVCTSKQENVATYEHLESACSNTFDVMNNQSLELLKSETVEQDCWLEGDKKICVKEELLHEELDIKSEDEATQDTCVDEKHNLRNKFPKHRKHPSIVKPFKCNICDQSCLYKSNLKIHLRTHTGEKPFKCNICDYSCGQNSSLTNHFRTHTGEKRFKCNICDFSSVHNKSLRNHVLTHTGEKPFKCNICDYSCNQVGHLKRHLKNHSGEKPFKCNICDYSCGQKNNLKRHLRTHTGEKPFKCEVCHYRSAHRPNLIRHLQHSHVSQKS